MWRLLGRNKPQNGDASWSIKLEIKSPCESHMSCESPGWFCLCWSCACTVSIFQLFISRLSSFNVWLLGSSSCVFSQLFCFINSSVVNHVAPRRCADWDLLLLRLDQPYRRQELRHRPLFVVRVEIIVGNVLLGWAAQCLFLSVSEVLFRCFRFWNTLGITYFVWIGQLDPQQSADVR